MTERYLLDTCAAVWIAEGSALSDPAMEAVREAEAGKGALSVSPITAWEIGMLAAKGRVAIRSSPNDWFRRLCDFPGVELVGLDADVLIDSSFLPGEPDGDPADRIIIATARAAGMTVLTRDRAMLDYAAQGHVLALEC